MADHPADPLMQVPPEPHVPSPHLAHHFDNPQQQFATAKLGMWIFLSTEVLMFGGLFCAYAAYRGNHPEIFEYAHRFLDKTMGGINTLVLICSSLTMAWAVRAVQLNQRKTLVVCLAMTILGGLGFMGIKGIEYHTKWREGLLWGAKYSYKPEEGSRAQTQGSPQTQPSPATQAIAATAPMLDGVEISRISAPPIGPAGLALGGPSRQAHDENAPHNVSIFFTIYFAMTGLHAIHVLIGIGLISWLLVRSLAGQFNSQYFTPVDLVGLYWHLVDLIWIFLFPLLYLIH